MPVNENKRPLTVDEKKQLFLILQERKARGLPLPEGISIPISNVNLTWHTDENGYFVRNDGRPFTPRPVLEDFINDSSRFLLLKAGRGAGKALPLDTKIPTPDGWKTMGDIQIGDWVFSETGEPTEVIGTSEVMYGHDCYEMSLSSGEKIIADAEHLWTVYKLRSPNPINLTTEQLSQYGLKYDSGYMFKIQNCEPVQYSKKNLPIHPYLLGVWLGDGNKRDTGITIHDDDTQIVNHIHSLGYPIHKLRELYGWSLGGDGEVLKHLRNLGVLNNKHIPEIYLQSSVEDRLELLYGLMDTDGTISKRGHCSFDNKNKRLIDDTYELINSLGIKASIHQYESKHNGNTYEDTYKISFTPKIPVFRLQRKLDRQRLSDTKNSINFRQITGIKKVSSVPVKCIKVASKNSLFLIDKCFLPTHNTVAGAQKALKKIKEGKSGAVMNPDF